MIGTKTSGPEQALDIPEEILGAWDVEATQPDGTVNDSTLTWSIEDGRLVGLLVTTIGEAKITDVHFDGNKYRYTSSIEMGPGMTAKLESEGEIMADGTLGGTAKLDLGEEAGGVMEFTIKGTKSTGE